MKREEIMERADLYIESNGFPPGCLKVRRDGAYAELTEYFDTALTDNEATVRKTLIEDSIENAEKLKIMGMAVRLSDDLSVPWDLTRVSGSVTRIRPKDGGELYNPQADITNSLGSILKAAFSVFNGEEPDPATVAFAKDCCILMDDAAHSNEDWETRCLPGISKLCIDFIVNNKDNADRFFIKFFMCVMDFHWHCSRLIPGDSRKDSSDIFNKALTMSSFVRTMPEYMRTAYMDHIAAHGMMPELFTAPKKEE